MTKNTTATALWDSMTDQQKIEWLAVKVMGWSKEPKKRKAIMASPYYWYGENDEIKETRMGMSENLYRWNPLTDQNHWRQVEEKVMENDNLWMEFIKRITIEKERVVMLPWEIGMIDYMKADLPTRARALYLAFQRHYDSGRSGEAD